MWPVSTRVNGPKNDDPNLVEAVDLTTLMRRIGPPGPVRDHDHITGSVHGRRGSMSDTFLQLLSRVGSAALVRATLGLVVCLGLAAVSRKGAGSVLPAVALVYSMFGTLTLSWGLRAEKQNNLTEAASFYVLALVHYFVSYASAAALALVS